MRPAEQYGRGVRILARTALEVVRDPLGNRIDQDMAPIAVSTTAGSTLGVVDPFTGAGDALYSILRHLPGAQEIGSELKLAIFDMTRKNLALIAALIRLYNGDFRTLLGPAISPRQHIVAFLAPQWADALNTQTGPDLGRTKPPLADTVEACERVYVDNPML